MSVKEPESQRNCVRGTEYSTGISANRRIKGRRVIKTTSDVAPRHDCDLKPNLCRHLTAPCAIERTMCGGRLTAPC